MSGLLVLMMPLALAGAGELRGEGGGVDRGRLWSMEPVRVVDPPPAAPGDWGRGAVDRFILARLQASGLAPAPAAGRRELVRRLSFALTGLPPEPEVVDELEAVAAEEWPQAWRRLVDRWLASPRFGEHWARHWLDVVRYSDSNGFDWDEYRPEAWRFRDYVVASFNADKPFDRFLTEQLAGDELLAGPPRDEAEREALIATGYLRLGPQDNSASLFNEQDRARHEVLSDLTETTASAFLALTLSCCRCHDHKTEPLSHEDYFRFRAFFEAVAPGDELALDLAAEQVAILAQHDEVAALLRALGQQRDGLRAGVRERLVASGVAEPSAEAVGEAMTDEEKARDRSWADEMAAAEAGRRVLTRGLLMTDAPGARGTPAVSRLLAGGDHRQPRHEVVAGFPVRLDPSAVEIVAPPNPATSGRRLTLARWLARPDHPLTARVYANRVWQALFGRGLVATAIDFGWSGERPTQPDVLAWLATELVRGGWSTKNLLRLILVSETYQQSAVHPAPPAADADGLLWWRQSMRRLTAEQLRDAQLAVAGLLLPVAGGVPVWPELPREILTANPAFLDDNAEKTKGWYASPPGEQAVRSLFLVQKRTVRVPLLEVFDLPENATSCGRRTVSTVAPQALTLLNGPLTAEVAAGLARRIEAAAGTEPGARVEAAFRLALQRRPSADERARCLDFLERRSLEELARVMINLNEFIHVD